MSSEPAAEIMDGITMGTTFAAASKLLRPKLAEGAYYRESQRWRLKGDRMVFTNLAIHLDWYELFFFGRGKRVKLTGFDFVLPKGDHTHVGRVMSGPGA